VKKAFAIFLAFIFLLSTSGFAVNIHYCPVKHKISFGSYSAHAKSCCAKKSAPDNCCKHETKYFKVKTDFSSSASILLPELKSLTTEFLAASFINEASFNFSHFIFYADTGPPELPVSRSILFRSLLI
jgi:hypothetical protein